MKGTGHWKVANSGREFILALCTSWQVDLRHRYHSLLCLDSTHNICCALESSCTDFLHSILIKHDEPGCGVSLTLIVTGTEIMVPLEEWLRWLKDNVPCEWNLIVIIYCSETEVAALNAVYVESKICFCHWHIFRALRSQANYEMGVADDRRLAPGDLKSLSWAKKISEFNFIWDSYKTKYVT